MFITYPDIVILAGGLGTRLQNEVKNLPKAMAPINGKPFLEYLLNYIEKSGFKRIILSTGYLSSYIQEYFGSGYKNLLIEYIVEDEPLGTGGAIKLASTKVQSPHFIVMNGDTFFPINLQNFFQFHVETLADVSMALRKVDDASRYGEVECDSSGRVVRFNEKSKHVQPGLINGGTYIISTRYFKKLNLPAKFSFETNFLQTDLSIGYFLGQEFDDYFLDIGVPEDYKRAQIEFNAL
ncbi:MAG: nucleotidyltransferase family protein [Chloroflexota bacterium]